MATNGLTISYEGQEIGEVAISGRKSFKPISTDGIMGGAIVQAGMIVAAGGGPEDLAADALAGTRIAAAAITVAGIWMWNNAHNTESVSQYDGGTYHRMYNADEQTADEILPGSLKKSPSYNPNYGGNTRSELEEMAKEGDRAAAKMKKLVDNVPRLLDKIKKQMIDIHNIIESFLEKHNRCKKQMKILKGSFEDENKFWALLDNKEEDFFNNGDAFNLLADSLQLVNNKHRLETFDLKDIEKMYRLLVKYYPENLQYKIDLVNFVYVVLDDESEALSLIIEAQRQILKYNESINIILSELKGRV